MSVSASVFYSRIPEIIEAWILNHLIGKSHIISINLNNVQDICDTTRHFNQVEQMTLTELLLIARPGFLMAVDDTSVGGIKVIWEFDNGFVVSNRMEIVDIAVPLDGTRSFTDCN